MGTKVREQIAADPAKVFPLLSPIINELKSLIASEKASATGLTKLVEQDPALSAKLLAILSSPLYAQSFPDPSQISLQIGALRLEAVTFLSLAQTIAIYAAFEDFSFPEGFSHEGFWMHSLGVAMAAELLVPYVGLSSSALTKSNAFLAGLCHDLGKLVFMDQFPSEFRDLLDLVEQNGLRMHEGELVLFEVGHNEISESLMRYWGLSKTLAEGTRWYHAPAECPGQGARPLAYLVQLADFIANHLNFGDGGNRAGLDLPKEAFAALKIDEGAIPEIVTRVRAKSNDAASFIRLCASPDC